MTTETATTSPGRRWAAASEDSSWAATAATSPLIPIRLYQLLSLEQLIGLFLAVALRAGGGERPLAALLAPNIVLVLLLHMTLLSLLVAVRVNGRPLSSRPVTAVVLWLVYALMTHGLAPMFLNCLMDTTMASWGSNVGLHVLVTLILTNAFMILNERYAFSRHDFDRWPQRRFRSRSSSARLAYGLVHVASTGLLAWSVVLLAIVVSVGGFRLAGAFHSGSAVATSLLMSQFLNSFFYIAIYRANRRAARRQDPIICDPDAADRRQQNFFALLEYLIEVHADALPHWIHVNLAGRSESFGGPIQDHVGHQNPLDHRGRSLSTATSLGVISLPDYLIAAYETSGSGNGEMRLGSVPRRPPPYTESDPRPSPPPFEHQTALSDGPQSTDSEPHAPTSPNGSSGSQEHIETISGGHI